MDMADLIDKVIEIEWTMFRDVNRDDHVSCQEDRPSFEAMRRAQFSAWSEQAIASYLLDLTSAQATGRNLVREKYIRMMKSTDPEAYEKLKSQLPALSDNAKALVRELWGHLLVQTERMRLKYPILALNGRPLRACEEKDQWASIETYQISELETYSESTLQLLLEHLLALAGEGKDLAYIIQENSVTCLGYRDLAEAEASIEQQFDVRFECGSCGQQFSWT